MCGPRRTRVCALPQQTDRSTRRCGIHERISRRPGFTVISLTPQFASNLLVHKVGGHKGHDRQIDTFILSGYPSGRQSNLAVAMA